MSDLVNGERERERGGGDRAGKSVKIGSSGGGLVIGFIFGLGAVGGATLGATFVAAGLTCFLASADLWMNFGTTVDSSSRGVSVAEIEGLRAFRMLAMLVPWRVSSKSALECRLSLAE